MSEYDRYTIFLPNGEVVESHDGVAEIHRIEGTVVRGVDNDGPTWHCWCLSRVVEEPHRMWQILKPEDVPAEMRAYALINPL